MKAVLNHVALLVSSIEETLEKLEFPSDVIGQIEEFPNEGTRELYIGGSAQMGRLLLMQAIGDGPYLSAYQKRGPGLHHLAIDVANLEQFASSLSGAGWLLHPRSIEFYNTHRLIFICRPQIPVLIEVQERSKLFESNFFINEVEFPFKEQRLLDSLCCKQLKMGDNFKYSFGAR